MRRLSFHAQLAVVAVVGFAFRVGYAAVVFGDKGPQADGLYYAAQAEMIADGHWFEHPFQLGTEAADHPPLNSLVLSVPAWLWRGNFMAMRVTLCLVGTLTIVLVGVLGRLVARRAGALYADRVGLIAAVLATVYANLWMNDVIMMAEAVTAACLAGALVAAYLLIESPSTHRAAVLGGLIALSALARAEIVVLGLLIAVPAILVGSRDWRGRLGQAAACAGAALLVLAPWVGYNLSRFDRPTYLSSGEGHVVAGANCPSTYHGRAIGFWSYGCAFEEPEAPVDVDQSELSAWYGARGAAYRSDHLGRLPVVVGARLARAWSIGWVDEMANVNSYEGRPVWASKLGVASFWALVPVAIGGAVAARRRDLVVWPLLMLPLLASGIAAWYYGIVRFRLPAEFTLVVLAAIGIAVLWDRIRAGIPGHRTDDERVTGS
ncbi:MAG: ArnT family glycosyltransferase [Acidimicrobiales bacterium]